jgi:hypothetical protein
LLALLGDLPSFTIRLALQLHQLETGLAVEFLLAAALFQVLLSLHGPLAGLGAGDDHWAR